MYSEPIVTPQGEEARSRALDALRLLDTPPEEAFQALAALASQVLGCPMALITLIDRSRQWIKASIGTDLRETSRDVAFCDHTIRRAGLMIVPDATKDARFSANPFVTEHPNVRFYAGVPISARDPETRALQRVGAICGIDTEPRHLDVEQQAALKQLGILADALLTARAISGESLEIAALAQTQTEALQRSVTAFRQAERIAQIGSWRIDLRDMTLDWSEGVYRIYGLPDGAPVDLAAAMAPFPEETRQFVQASLEATRDTGALLDLETDFRTADGGLRRVRSLGERVETDGRPVAVAGIFQDVTDRYRLEQSLRRLAEVDPVTGIANRAAFNRALEQAVDAAAAGGGALMLVLADLDHFKQANDVHGHAAGDDLLRVVGERLSNCGGNSGRGCFAARLGGDEFALIVTDPDLCARPDPFIEGLLAMLNQPAATSYGVLPVSLTIGYDLFRGDVDVTLREFVHRIDSALYEAKRAQRGSARRYVAKGRRSTD
jgi:diguanylate cyclase (GGDEF)-like protein/PAS domain S-box-containing protein